jgi:hypothetical protein
MQASHREQPMCAEIFAVNLLSAWYMLYILLLLLLLLLLC